MSDIAIQPCSRPFRAEITPPGSKSLTNRALVLAALAEGTSLLTNCLLADDTLVMIDGLRRLGFRIDADEPSRTMRVHGSGGRVPGERAELFCGNSGTTIRFLTALCALGRGRYLLDGVPRMRQRPIGQLVDLLRNLGARIEYAGQTGYPPVEVLAGGLAGGIARFGDAQSSQYLSAAVQVCPYARFEARIDLAGRQTSWPYVAMTMRMMDHFGITPEVQMDKRTGLPSMLLVPLGRYRACDYAVEPDASSASYFLAAAAIHPDSSVTIRGLGSRSLQGDVGFADILRRMGAMVKVGPDSISVAGTGELKGTDADLRDMPDMAQTLAVTALFARGPTTIRGLHTLRLKETDRLAALAAELAKFGAAASVEQDTLRIDPPDALRPAAVETYDDHRMAMSFAVAGTKLEGVVIRNAGCVGKTYPGFFEDLMRVTNCGAQPAAG